jgi:hypothetical protein
MQKNKKMKQVYQHRQFSTLGGVCRVGGFNRYVQSQKNVAMPILLGMATFAATPTYPSTEYVHASTVKFGLNFLCNENHFINRVHSATIGVKMLSSTSTRNVTGAPIWLKKRMETLRQMPPPTLQEVRTQLAASAETRKKLTDKQSV